LPLGIPAANATACVISGPQYQLQSTKHNALSICALRRFKRMALAAIGGLHDFDQE
jgi:hypothetical protein